MKRDLMDILACPVCKGALELSVDREEDGQIVDGKPALRGLRRGLPH